MYRPPRGIWVLRSRVLLAAATVLLVLFYVVNPLFDLVIDGHILRNGKLLNSGEIRQHAVETMRESIAVIRTAREKRGIAVDPRIDANETGLIGYEYSETTTTLGDLAAKRTATNPAWAGVIAGWMLDAGVGPGDVVWATFSGSFPGLNLATIAAAEAVGVRLSAISSLGASMWGANIPEFPWSDMEAALDEAGIVSHPSVAFTLGGDYDRGPALLGDGTGPLREAIARTSIPLLEPADLEDAISIRLDVFARASGAETPKLLVNVGGGHAVMGNCLEAASLPSGLIHGPFRCSGDVAGLVHVLAAQDVPVIHLLNIKELAFTVGIPIDGRF